MSLSTAKFVKKSRIMARPYFIFVKNILNQPWKAFNTKFQPQSEDQNSSYQVRQSFALFFNLIALTLVQNSVKSPTVTKIVKKIKFEGVWEVRNKNRVPETISYKIFETESSFHVKERTIGKV